MIARVNPPPRRALVLPATLAITVLAGACLCGCGPSNPGDAGPVADATDDLASDVVADDGDNNGCPSGCGRLTLADGGLGTYPDGAPYCLC